MELFALFRGERFFVENARISDEEKKLQNHIRIINNNEMAKAYVINPKEEKEEKKEKSRKKKTKKLDLFEKMSNAWKGILIPSDGFLFHLFSSFLF